MLLPAKVGILIQKSVTVWHKFLIFAQLIKISLLKAWYLLTVGKPKTL